MSLRAIPDTTYPVLKTLRGMDDRHGFLTQRLADLVGDVCAQHQKLYAVSHTFHDLDKLKQYNVPVHVVL